MISRRELLIAFVLSPFAAPGVSLAQKPTKAARIGFLGATSAAGSLSALRNLRSAFRDLGYAEGTNFVFEFRWAEGNYEALPKLADDLVRSNVDVIVSAGTPATLAAKRATASIPIVMTNVGDAVGSGLVASLARPGGNVTGSTIFSPVLMTKRLELIREIVPRMRKVAVLFNARNPAQQLSVREIGTAARSLKLELERVAIGSAAELQSSFAMMASRGVDAVVLTVDSLFTANHRAIADLAAGRRMPSAGPREFAEEGGLIGYGAVLRETYVRTAFFVDRILKGARPADLPVEQPTRFEFQVNLKTARRIGITVPQALLARADRVIE